jgi:rhamnosyltransferase
MKIEGANGAQDRSPAVVVLLACWNGERFLQEQIASILSQSGVSASVFVSDDCSTDRSLQILKDFDTGDGSVVLLPSSGRMGSASANFFRLIADIDHPEAAYFALADQDDIWLNEKVGRAVGCILTSGADGYSGPVTAVWPDGRSKFIDKHSRMRARDYFFESPGPGCTFVLRRDLFLRLQQFVRENRKVLRGVYYHDWFIYAFARSHGYRWYIDSQPHMLYRQHESNDTGANVGFGAIWVRVRKVWSGWARMQAYLIADVCGYGDELRSRFVFTPRRVLAVICRIADYRRSRFGRLALAISVLLGRMRPP